MSLNEPERNTLVALYIDKAERIMHEAEIAMDAKSWGMASNRLYYALFHAVTALFVFDGITVGSHRGVKAKFGQHYVMTKKFTTDDAKTIAHLETLRDKADYNIMFIAEAKDVLPHVDNVKSLIKTIENYVK